MSSEIRGHTYIVIPSQGDRIPTAQLGFSSLCLPQLAGTKDVLLPLSDIQKAMETSSERPPGLHKGELTPPALLCAVTLRAGEEKGESKHRKA